MKRTVSQWKIFSAATISCLAFVGSVMHQGRLLAADCNCDGPNTVIEYKDANGDGIEDTCSTTYPCVMPQDGCKPVSSRLPAFPDESGNPTAIISITLDQGILSQTPSESACSYGKPGSSSSKVVPSATPTPSPTPSPTPTATPTPTPTPKPSPTPPKKRKGFFGGGGFPFGGGGSGKKDGEKGGGFFGGGGFPFGG